jgi:hypothetical protein
MPSLSGKPLHLCREHQQVYLTGRLWAMAAAFFTRFKPLQSQIVSVANPR